MGAEIGNLHLGSISAEKLRGELRARRANAGWLRKAAKNWKTRVEEDFAEFCRKPKSRTGDSKDRARGRWGNVTDLAG
jgi:hypothetical protein